MKLFCLIFVIVLAGVCAGENHEQIVNVNNEKMSNDEFKMNNYTTLGLETTKESSNSEQASRSGIPKTN